MSITLTLLYKGTAQQIAEKVNQQAHAHNWYTTNVTLDTPSKFWKIEKNLVSEYIRIHNIHLEKYHPDITNSNILQFRQMRILI